MTQITWVPAQAAATTGKSTLVAATTGYAQILPEWAPDIMYLPTTTVVDYNVYVMAATTTTAGMRAGTIRQLHVRGWRKHGGRQYVALDGESGTFSKVTLAYMAVGELVRT